MTEPLNQSPRSRMQALLAIPDNQRTEEQWDELHELEITLAPGNRIGHQEKQNPPGGQGKSRGGQLGNPRGGNPQGAPRGDSRGRGGRNPQAPRSANAAPRRPVVDVALVEGVASEAVSVEVGGELPPGGVPAKKPFRRFHKKPPKPAEG